jgi:hypothetical protein
VAVSGRPFCFHPGSELRRSRPQRPLEDIGTEELSHLEVVGSLARRHLKPMKFDREKAEADPLIAIAGGGNLFNSQGKSLDGRLSQNCGRAGRSTCAAISQQKPARRSFTKG